MELPESGKTGLPPMRLWPGVAAVTLQWAAWFGVPAIAPDASIYGALVGLAAGLVILVWWTFLSRAPRLERWGVLPVLILAPMVTSRFIDKSIATGMMSMMFTVYSVPAMSLALVAGAVAGSRLSIPGRRAAMLVSIVLVSAGCTLVRTNGIYGTGRAELAWRWSKTGEERLVSQPDGRLAALPSPPALEVAAKSIGTPVPAPAPTPVATPVREPVLLPPAPSARLLAPVSWPGFRGLRRDSIVPGTHIQTDWTASPPVELWRRKIGPGWSSFSVAGDLIYTQEQRGEDELVTCYNATSGIPVWAHRDAARFWESNAGAGPRATPTLHDGKVYTFGATGIVNALNGVSGKVLWTRNTSSDADVKTPGWGFASSPVVYGDTLIVAASGKLIAYDLATGAPRWVGPTNGGSYSSPHILTLDGVPQILLMTSIGATSVAPADGSPLWKYAWRSDTRIMQPAMTAEGDLVISAGDAMGGEGLRRITVAHDPSGWSAAERWTSIGLKPSFNDFVVHNGHVYGFDGGILACIDVKDGARKWKGGRYGHGQLVLLRDQNVLLVLSEEGELALVKAEPDQFTELSRIPAIEGKTWNHPVLAGDRLLVRNGSEMVAFRLPQSGS